MAVGTSVMPAFLSVVCDYLASRRSTARTMANIITAGLFTYPAPTTVLLPLRGQCLRCRLATHPWGVQPKRNPATEQVLLLLHALLAFRHPVPSPAAAFFSTTRPQGCKLPCICNGAGVAPISFPPSIAPPSLQAGAVALWGLPQFRPKHCRPPPAPSLPRAAMPGPACVRCLASRRQRSLVYPLRHPVSIPYAIFPLDGPQSLAPAPATAMSWKVPPP